MANKSKSAGAVAQAVAYKNEKRNEKNRKAKLERQLKLQPGNEKQILAAIANIRYRRKTPLVRVWSHSMRRTAELFKYFSGKVDKDIFSTNEKISTPALALHSNFTKQNVNLGNMFNLGTRAYSKNSI